MPPRQTRLCPWEAPAPPRLCKGQLSYGKQRGEDLAAWKCNCFLQCRHKLFKEGLLEGQREMWNTGLTIFLLSLLLLQEFIPSFPALHTGIALCTGCPCARTARLGPAGFSPFQQSHCLSLARSPSHPVPVPTKLRPQQEGMEKDWDPYTVQDLWIASPGCCWCKIKAAQATQSEGDLERMIQGPISAASFLPWCLMGRGRAPQPPPAASSGILAEDTGGCRTHSTAWEGVVCSLFPFLFLFLRWEWPQFDLFIFKACSSPFWRVKPLPSKQG